MQGRSNHPGFATQVTPGQWQHSIVARRSDDTVGQEDPPTSCSQPSVLNSSSVYAWQPAALRQQGGNWVSKAQAEASAAA
jgi:hypothetical protein